METTIITLTDDLFIGKGYHKKCYRHPHDPGLCIKWPTVTRDKRI